MTTIFRVQVESIEGPLLTLHVNHVYGWDWDRWLVASRTLVLHFLWDPLLGRTYRDLITPDGRAIPWHETEANASVWPLGLALEGRSHVDEEWNRANVGQFISCAGMVDRQHFYEVWNDNNASHEYWQTHEREELPEAQATFLAAVTNPRWLAHLSPGMEWDSAAYDHDEKVSVDPAWRTEAVIGIARAISEDGAFERMPILADALQDAGCEDEQLLGHCRNCWPHVRGCWAVELLLGNDPTQPLPASHSNPAEA